MIVEDHNAACSPCIYKMPEPGFEPGSKAPQAFRISMLPHSGFVGIIKNEYLIFEHIYRHTNPLTGSILTFSSSISISPVPAKITTPFAARFFKYPGS